MYYTKIKKRIQFTKLYLSDMGIFCLAWMTNNLLNMVLITIIIIISSMIIISSVAYQWFDPWSLKHDHGFKQYSPLKFFEIILRDGIEIFSTNFAVKGNNVKKSVYINARSNSILCGSCALGPYGNCPSSGIRLVPNSGDRMK